MNTNVVKYREPKKANPIRTNYQVGISLIKLLDSFTSNYDAIIKDRVVTIAISNANVKSKLIEILPKNLSYLSQRLSEGI